MPSRYTGKKILLNYRNFLAAKLPENIRSATEKICWQNFPVTKLYIKYSTITDIFCIAKYVKLKRKVKPTYPTRIRTRQVGTGSRRSDHYTIGTRIKCDPLQFSYQYFHYQNRKKSVINRWNLYQWLQILSVYRENVYFDKLNVILRYISVL